MIATGMQHAALLSNDEAFERVVYDAGRVLLLRAFISLTFGQTSFGRLGVPYALRARDRKSLLLNEGR